MTNRLKIGQEVLIHGYVDEIRKDTIIIQNDGGYFGTVEWEVTDIEMPFMNKPCVARQVCHEDKVKVLDKIRAELHATAEMHEDGDYYLREKWIDEIINKHKAESEDKE